MFSKEDFDSWNEFFPDDKIKQSDLANPTETFLTKTLILYLKKFGYDINANMQYPQKGNEADNLRERRLFLIKLAKHIDHILKITDKGYIFTYYDLIHPTPKKTSHMLGILLNHLCYYNLYKTEVFNKANAAIQEREELLKRLCEVEEDNATRKLKAAKIKDEIAALTEQIPKAQTKLKSLTAAKVKQQEEKFQFEEAFKDIKTKLDELDLQKRSLKKKIVPDSEATELQTQLKNLQEKIEEQNEQEASTKSSLKETTENLKSMQDLLKEITDAQELLPLHQLAQLKDVDKKLKEAKFKANTKRETKQNLTTQIDTQQNELKKLDEKLTTLKKDFDKEKSEIMQKINSLESGCKKNDQQLDKQQQELHTVDCLLDEQQRLSRFLEESISILMKPYMGG